MTPDVFEIDSVDFSHRNTKQRSSPQVLSVGSVRSLRWFSCRCVSRCVLTVFFLMKELMFCCETCGCLMPCLFDGVCMF